MNTSPDDEQFMARALALADAAAAQDEVPVGALVVLDGRVVGEGFNCPVTSADPTAHAEIRALRDAAERLGNYRLSGATLYVTLEPCTMCAGALVHARIERLVYATTEPRSGAVVSSARVLDNAALNHRVAVTGGVLAEEAARRLRQFFRQRRALSAAART